MRELGLPLDILWPVDKGTDVTVRSSDGVPELLIFRRQTLAGSVMGVVPATRPTVSGGMVGGTGPYLFGAGQGPLSRVEVDEPEARTALVNPEVDGWVIVVPETVGSETVTLAAHRAR